MRPELCRHRRRLVPPDGGARTSAHPCGDLGPVLWCSRWGAGRGLPASVAGPLPPACSLCSSWDTRGESPPWGVMLTTVWPCGSWGPHLGEARPRGCGASVSLGSGGPGIPPTAPLARPRLGLSLAASSAAVVWGCTELAAGSPWPQALVPSCGTSDPEGSLGVWGQLPRCPRPALRPARWARATPAPRSPSGAVALVAPRPQAERPSLCLPDAGLPHLPLRLRHLHFPSSCWHSCRPGLVHTPGPWGAWDKPPARATGSTGLRPRGS